MNFDWRRKEGECWQVNLSGSKLGIKSVALLLNTQCKLCFHQENERTKDLIIEQKFHRTIIGQKGERIREIREKFPEVRLSRR